MSLLLTKFDLSSGKPQLGDFKRNHRIAWNSNVPGAPLMRRKSHVNLNKLCLLIQIPICHQAKEVLSEVEGSGTVQEVKK